jgi:hypothetical protein
MKQVLEQLLQQLDAALLETVGRASGTRLDLYLIGRGALVLFHNLQLPPGGTKDLDVVQLVHPPNPLLAQAVALFGKETDWARKNGVYLELVPSGLPPMPAWFDRRSTEQPGPWSVLRLWQVEVHDLAASKLKSFRSQDRTDLRFLCDQGKLSPESLRESLNHAFLWSTPKDGDPDYDRAFANLDRVLQYLEGQIPSL